MKVDVKDVKKRERKEMMNERKMKVVRVDEF